jgi:uncharacterized protein
VTQFRTMILTFLALSFCGCAVLRDHNKAIEVPYNDFKKGNFAAASEGFKEGSKNQLDGLCFTFDRGTVHYVAGQWDKSIRLFQAAKQIMGGFDDRAEVSVSDIAQTTASFLVNEKTIPYKGEGFERILLPSFQARNYFLKGDVEGAAVEARRSLFQQKLVKRQFEVELEEAEKTAKKKRSEVAAASTEGFFSAVQKKCRVDQAYLDDPQSIYQLAFVNYITAMMLEAQGDDNNARVFYLKVYDVLPEHQTILKDMAHIENKLGNIEEAKKYAEVNGDDIPDAKTGSIVVLYDSGEAPIKFENSVTFLTGGFGFQKFALPFYQSVSNPAGSVVLEINKQAIGSEKLTSVEQVAFRYFNDRMPLIVAKAIIRVLAKIAIQKVSELATANNAKSKLAGALIGLGTSLVMSITEQADLRSWRTLPQNFQAAKVFLPEGQYPATLKLMSRSGQMIDSIDLGSVSVTRGKIELINVRSVGRRFWAATSPELGVAKNSPTPPKRP